MNPQICRGLKGSVHIVKNNLVSFATDKRSLQSGKSKAGLFLSPQAPYPDISSFNCSSIPTQTPKLLPRLTSHNLIEPSFKQCKCVRCSRKMTLTLVNFCTASLGENRQVPQLPVVSGRKQTSQFASREKTTKDMKMRFLP